ncbi:hypothetical protein HDU76_003502 [Blyttiomyces sp. JEL0837]|nr:hypothetical protein HDU76_003502 [Blyttiomyces sp. JEL0837]
MHIPLLTITHKLLLLLQTISLALAAWPNVIPDAVLYQINNNNNINTSTYNTPRISSRQSSEGYDDGGVSNGAVPLFPAALTAAPSGSAYKLTYYGKVAPIATFRGAVTIPKLAGVLDEAQMRPILTGLIKRKVLPADTNGIYMFIGGPDVLADQATDPLINQALYVGPPVGWYNEKYGEIADICNSIQGVSTSTVPGVPNYLVQQLWSNAKMACVS